MKKRQRYKKLIMLGIILIIWSALVGVWAYVWNSHYSSVIMRPFGYKGNWLIYFLYGLIVFSFTALYGGYRVGYYKRGDVIFSNILSVFIANSVTYIQTCLVAREIMRITPFFFMTVIDIFIIWVWASAMNKVYLKLYPPHNMLVIYGGEDYKESLVSKMGTRAEKYKICKTVCVHDEPIEEIYKMIMMFESVIICDVKSGLRNKILKFCFGNSVRTYLTPKISDVLIRGAEEINLFDTPLLLSRSHGLSTEQRIFKRAMDIIISGLGSIICAPIMAIVAVAIKLQDGGPILYKQERLTLNGKTFSLLKFRSMIIDAENDGIARLASQDDKRITKIGKLIRSMRLDELPQLINILRGDMSVVGPRPERPEIAVSYEAEIPEFSYRLKVKAGLTGYAQIVGKYNTTAYDKLKLDLMYIENYSLALDFKLILMTIKIMFMKASTEGVKEVTCEVADEDTSINTNKNTKI